ncbi:AcrB/AcrD/AcrF family protein [Sphingomonas sp. CJ99]
MPGQSVGTGWITRQLDRHWLRWVLIAWAAIALVYIVQRYPQIRYFVLTDTDDNLRMAQVRAWLAGQPWADLRQYRLNPPGGLDIHWSRLVDLPIAALIVMLKPFVGGAWAERWAAGIAPLLPLGVTLTALSLTVRRLVAPRAWPLAILFLFGCTSALLMFMPMRVDHHGWQLACLAWTLAGLADPRGGRGGAVVGAASAVSLTIGLELLPYAVMAGAILTLEWVWDDGRRDRLMTYGLTLAGGVAAGFAVFASHANWAMRCDALTPIWLSAMLAVGGLLFLIARLNPAGRTTRLLLAAAAGAVVGGTFVTLFPQCLARPEGVSDELVKIWLGNVREAKPIFQHPLKTGLSLASVPMIGLIGAMIAAWRARGTPRLTGWIAASAFIAFAGAMMLWQVRSAPAAQLIGMVGSVALAWWLLPWCMTHRLMPVRVFGTVGGALVLSGLAIGLVIDKLPVPDKGGARRQVVQQAARQCNTLSAMRPLAQLPAQTIFTHIDLSPRLITLTRHSAIAGPYHRNERAILDVHNAFAGSPEQFRRIAAAHGATLLAACPNMAETTIYRARGPNGFYARLMRGERFDWLEPVTLNGETPLRVWRIR